MKRELKFRAWDIQLNKYHYYNGIFNNRPYTEKSTFIQYGSLKEYHDDVVVQQYTGINDKNGRGIYEGDIVVLHDELLEWDDLIVKYEHESARFVLFNTTEKIRMSFYDVTEVIGNIYETPELLHCATDGGEIGIIL